MTDVAEPGPDRGSALSDTASGSSAAAVPGPGVPVGRGRGPLVIAAVLASVVIGAWAVVTTRETPERASGDDRTGRDDRENRRMAQFAGALRNAVAAMKSRSYDEATPLLAAAAALQPHAHITRLTQLNAALADKPTDHVDQILEVSEVLSQLRGNVWVESGVVELAREIFDTWKHERTNARHAGIGDDKLADGLWCDALEQYNQIPRESPLYVVRLPRIEAARAKVAEEMRALALAGNQEEALIKFDIVLGNPPGIEVERARALRRGREEIAAQHYDAAKAILETIPASSIYFRDAAEGLATIDHDLARREVLRLYQLGEGAKALALLDGQVAKERRALRERIERLAGAGSSKAWAVLRDGTSDGPDDMVALRETIEAVVGVYTNAQDLFEKKAYVQANELWDLVIRMVGDPGNQYTKWAEANKQVDPIALSDQLAANAAEMWAAGRLLDAAKRNTEALVANPKNAQALKLRGTIERHVNLRLAVARQWRSFDADSATSVTWARELYVLLRAASPKHPLLGAMAELVAKAGGSVPTEEGTGSGS